MESTLIYISFIRLTDNQSLSRSIEYVYEVLNLLSDSSLCTREPAMEFTQIYISFIRLTKKWTVGDACPYNHQG